MANLITTNNLWTEARRFHVDVERVDASNVKLVIHKPVNLELVDGAVVTIAEHPITANNYPSDGTQYNAGDNIYGARVVAFYSEINGKPWPITSPSRESGFDQFEITVAVASTSSVHASVHACSQILQYYPIGVQSYPGSSPSYDIGLSTYSGNIPSFPSAPTSPAVGLVYHDQGLNVVQYWNGSNWIPTRADTIVSDTHNPCTLGQVYLHAPGTLKVFNGVTWVTADASNMLVNGPTYVPLASVTSGIKIPANPNVGDVFYDYSTMRIASWNGSAWITPSATNTLFNGNIPAFTTPITVENVARSNPYEGQLFYNTSTKHLNVWTGTNWIQANTEQEGAPTTDKVAIGTNGSGTARAMLADVLKAQLGWPQNCVELSDEQFNIAIDNALDNYRQLSDGAYRKQYFTMSLLEGQQTYYLNSPVSKTDSIVDVHKIHRMSFLGVTQSTDNVFIQRFISDYFYSNNTTDLLSTHLLSGLNEDLERILAGNLTFVWNEATREITFTRKIATSEKVLIEAMCERQEQEILVDRWCKQYIQNWALAETKMILGLIRSKFSSGTPGASGPINLNGELLIAEARQDMTELKQALLDYEYGGHYGSGNVSFLIG
jgi:hypothetical protein